MTHEILSDGLLECPELRQEETTMTMEVSDAFQEIPS